MVKSRILLIEDNLSERIYLIEILTELGVEVEVAVNFARARELIKHKEFDLIISELLMTETEDLQWDGIQFWNYSQTVRPNLEVIIIAEEAIKQTTEEFMDGMNRPQMLAKPARPHALKEFVLQCLHEAKKVTA